MSDAAKRAQYDGFIFSALDRLGRNARHISAMRDWAEDHGKVLIVRSPHLIWPQEEDDQVMYVPREGRMSRWGTFRT
jgi:hypothetical protein